MLTEHPLTFVQEDFVRACGLYEARNTMPAAWRIFGDFSEDDIVSAWWAVVGRHEALRTRIIPTEHGHRQVVDAAAATPRALPSVDLTGSSDPVGELGRSVEEIISTPFDLAAGPGWRVVLAKTKDGFVLAGGFAHALIDGASVEVIARDLAGALGGTLSPREEVMQLGELARRHRGWSLSEDSRTWWADEYRHRPPPVSGEWNGPVSGLRIAPIPRFAAAAVARLAWQAPLASPSTVLGAVASLAYARVLGALPRLGFASGNRGDARAENAVGAFFDHLPVRVPDGRGSAFGAFATMLHGARDDSRTRRAPAGYIAQLTGCAVPYECAVNVRPFPEPAYHSAGRPDAGVVAMPIPAIGDVRVRRATSVTPPVAFILRPGAEGLTGDVVAIEAIVSEAQALDLAAAFAEIVAELLDRPDRSVAELLA